MHPGVTESHQTKPAIDPHFKVPIVRQSSIGRITFRGQQTAIHTVPLRNGLTLDFYAQLRHSDELLVLFHGAGRPHHNFYPRFERIRTFEQIAPALISFADPTLRLDPTGEIRLSWYLGGPDWDPVVDINRAIRKALGRTGARHVAFIGGSGGGFAALRAASMIPNSLAYVQDPQVVLKHYHSSVVDKYFQTAWPGWDQNALLDGFPERFDMATHYTRVQPPNFVYYAQNSSDRTHMSNHYKWFAEAHGLGQSGGLNKQGNRMLAVYDGERTGHGKITHQEYLSHFHQAMSFWRQARS